MRAHGVSAADVDKGMKKALSLPVLFALFAMNAFAGTFEGPLVIKNGQPLYVMLGSPSLTSAEPENSLDLSFSYSSTYLVTKNNTWYFGVDLETAVTDIQLKRVIGAGTELGLEIPIIRYGPGFMDNGIETFHRTFGISEHYGRGDRPHNQFLFEVTRNGTTVIRGEPGRTALGDISGEVKKTIYKNNASIVSVQAFLSVPTGDPDAGFGSGKTNGGMAVLMNETFLSDIMLYLNAGIGLIDQLDALQAVALRNYYYGGAGLEWRYSNTMLFNVQTIFQSSPLSTTGEKLVDGPSLMVSVGSRYKTGDLTSLGISLTEDPLSEGAPDIMMSVDYRRRF